MQAAAQQQSFNLTSAAFAAQNAHAAAFPPGYAYLYNHLPTNLGYGAATPAAPGAFYPPMPAAAAAAAAAVHTAAGGTGGTSQFNQKNAYGSR